MPTSDNEKSFGVTRIECATKDCTRKISIFSEYTKCSICREALAKMDAHFVPTAKLHLVRFRG